MSTIKKLPLLITKALPHKLCALIIGYYTWFALSSVIPAHRTVTVPLCFYATPANLTITGPEYITINLVSSRRNLAHLDTSKLAVHINTHALTQGAHVVPISYEQLLVPSTIRVEHSSPSNVVITAQTHHTDKDIA